jgi:EAL domain-containing protein (putative c-di-GMP-specific phosphodiesterase class I)
MKDFISNISLLQDDMVTEALSCHEFVPFYQPKFNIRSGKMNGTEALVRWIRKDDSIAEPESFINYCEQHGFITDIDYYILECSCREMHNWIKKQKQVVPVSCNFSRLHVNDSSFPDKVVSIVKKYDIPVSLVEIEFTETIKFENHELLQQQFSIFHNLGFSVSIDDFGAGYSSLRMLQYPGVDIIKLDKSLLGCGKTTEREICVLSAVTDLAHELGLSVTCEGVETEDHVRILKEIGCETAQGFFYSRPVPADQFEKFLD